MARCTLDAVPMHFVVIDLELTSKHSLAMHQSKIVTYKILSGFDYQGVSNEVCWNLVVFSCIEWLVSHLCTRWFILSNGFIHD